MRVLQQGVTSYALSAPSLVKSNSPPPTPTCRQSIANRHSLRANRHRLATDCHRLCSQLLCMNGDSHKVGNGCLMMLLAASVAVRQWMFTEGE